MIRALIDLRVVAAAGIINGLGSCSPEPCEPVVRPPYESTLVGILPDGVAAELEYGSDALVIRYENDFGQQVAVRYAIGQWTD